MALPLRRLPNAAADLPEALLRANPSAGRAAPFGSLRSMLARTSAKATAVAWGAAARGSGAKSALLRHASSSSRVGRQAIFSGLPVTFADISEARYRIRPGENDRAASCWAAIVHVAVGTWF